MHHVKAKSKAVIASTRIIPITVNYSKSLPEMIRLSGYKIPVGHEVFTPERFPIVGDGVVRFEAKLFHFNLDLTTKEVCELFASSEPENTWEPPGTEHVMAFGASFPRGKLDFEIICLIKNTDKNDPDFLCIYPKFENPKFVIIYGNETRTGPQWAAHYRFLAVRRKQLSVIP